MPRPHGLPRWAFLALACAAFFAVAMIPRGVVRTIEASHLADAIPAPGQRYEAPAPLQDELPGVRAVVSREERDFGLIPGELDAVLPDQPVTHDAAATAGDGLDEALPAIPLLDAAPRGSRAPPPSI